jgi:two-component SAPR family response regulator
MELKSLEEAIEFMEKKDLKIVFINQKFVTVNLIKKIRDFQSDKFKVNILEGYDRRSDIYYVRGIMIERK